MKMINNPIWKQATIGDAGMADDTIETIAYMPNEERARFDCFTPGLVVVHLTVEDLTDDERAAFGFPAVGA